jgi:selenide,water dikinase
MSGFDIHAATDVTGFGLAGHGFEIAKASNVCLEINIQELPIMEEALAMYKRGMTTGVNAYNRKMVEKHCRFETELPPWNEEIVFDPQTSGGLLVAVAQAQGEDLINALHAKGLTAAKIIGRIHELKREIHLRFR